MAGKGEKYTLPLKPFMFKGFSESHAAKPNQLEHKITGMLVYFVGP